jgi:hypothetical protein
MTEDEMAGACGIRNVSDILVVKSEGKRPLGRHMCKRENNIKMDLKETGWENVDWIRLVQDRDLLYVNVYTIMYLQFPYGARTFLTR